MFHPKKVDWFNEKKLGIVVHYGLYSQLGRGEWVQAEEHTPCEEYAKLAETFDPSGFDADRLARQAKEAGAGYMTLTTRHHEGFCLFDSKYSDFTSVKMCGRDLVREHVDACRKHGLRVGLYYSLLDWRFKGYHDREKYPESLEAMVEQLHGQVREILTNYGKIDYLWFDGGWFEDLRPSYDPVKAAKWSEAISKIWRSDELDVMIHELQPDIITNDRAGTYGDVVTPEQRTRGTNDERYTEACMTIGDRWGWGFINNNPNRKSSRCVLQHMIIQASFGGNFLLNIAPQPNGSTYGQEDLLLADIGKWLRTNGEAYYGTTAPSIKYHSMLGEFTQKGNNLYHHIFRWPNKGQVIISNVLNKVTKVTMLENGKEYPFEQTNDGRLVINEMPFLAPDTMATVLKIELSDEKIDLDNSYGTL